MVVYRASDDSDCLSLADEIAADRNEEVVTDLSELGNERVVYLALYEDISEADIIRLQERLLNRGPEAGFSLVSGRDATEARSLYDRETEAADDHCLLLRETDEDWFSYDDDTTVLRGETASVGHVEDLLDDGVESLSWIAHGRSMHLFLRDSFVCGYPSSGMTGDYQGPQPYCVTDKDERDCPLDGELMSAEEISVPHVFLNSCSSLFPENDWTGMPVHVGANLLESAESLIGSYRQIRGAFPHLVALHYCLLRAGYDLAERVYYLNQATHQMGVEKYPYVGFGRPSATVSNPTDSTYVSRISERTDYVEAVVEDVDTHVLELEVPANMFEDAGEAYVRNVSEKYKDAPIYFTVTKDRDNLRVLIFTWGAIDADELRFEIHPRPVLADEREVISDVIKNSHLIDDLSITDKKYRNQFSDLRNQVGGFADIVLEERFHTNQYRETRNKVQRALESVETMQHRLVSVLGEMSPPRLAAQYKSKVVNTKSDVQWEGCWRCDRSVFQKHLETPLRGARRTIGVCPKCGALFDVPREEDGTIAPPRIRDNHQYVEQGEVEPIRVEFENPLEHSMVVTMYPLLGTGIQQPRGALDVFDPERVERRVGPGETVRETFSVDTSILEQNEYWILCYVVGNANIYEGVSKMIVGDRPGHLRHDQRAEEYRPDQMYID